MVTVFMPAGAGAFTSSSCLLCIYHKMRKHLNRFYPLLILGVSVPALLSQEGLTCCYSTKQGYPQEISEVWQHACQRKQCLGPALFRTSLLWQEDAQAQHPGMWEPGLC